MGSENLEAYYGLPQEVKFCKKCVMSNQRPASRPEFKVTSKSTVTSMNFDEEGVCDACRFAEVKEQIVWKDREEQLLQLLDKYRSKDGSYDCICPGSGGKDSVYAAHLLKYKYGMHPLTVTWPPILYTDIGYQNFMNWLKVGGFDNLSYNQNGKVQKVLTRLSIENLLHPFQTFILGQKNLAPRMALKMGIPLIFYGENEAEYGNPIADNNSSMRDKSYHTFKNIDELSLGGVSIRELKEKYGFSMSDLTPYLPPAAEDFDKNEISVHYLGYYIKWTPQEAYYYSAEHTAFEANPFRTEGSYSKYNSLDDKIDGFHYYTTYIKFGIGRATYDASQEVRNKHIERDEAVALVKKYDGEFPQKYFKEVMEYIELDPDYFLELVDKFRSPHLWTKDSGEWKLRHTVWG